MKQERMLVVDDEAIVRQFNNGAIDRVNSDLVMAEMDGRGVLKEVKKNLS